MNLFRLFTDRVKDAVSRVVDSTGLPLDRILVEPPRDRTHGDLASNAAMVLAKDAGLKPRDLAEKIAAELRADPDIEAVDVAGPGFVNIRLKQAFWPGFLRAMLESGDAYGRTDIGKGEKVNVEYVSANPTGPLHVGHCRGAVFGDALANLLAVAGFDVTREYYINDAGAQVDVLARSAYLRYREALGETIQEIPEGLYPGDYLKPVGKALAERFGDTLTTLPEDQWLPQVRDIAIAAMLDLIRGDLAAIGIEHEVFFSERSLTEPPDRIATTIAGLEERGLVYTGRLTPPKGQPPEDWEDREQLLFKATDFGDDVDRPLKKSDGSHTYFASDIAYHRDKFERGFRDMILVVGADHGGYVKRMKAAVAAVSGRQAEIDVKLCQMVKLLRGGEPVRMSKRAGDFVTLREVVDEVGRDVVRFIMLTRKNDAPLDFDFVKVLDQSRENPVFYVQYAHARTYSVFAKAHEAFGDDTPGREDLVDADFTRLSDPFEIALLARIAEYPRLVEGAALSHEPHRLAFYLYDLAAEFHGLWNRGKELPQLRFINADDRESTRARLALVHAVTLVLASGLRILGVEPVTELR